MELVIIDNRRCDMILGGGRFDVSVEGLSHTIHGTGISGVYLPKQHLVVLYGKCISICTIHVSYGACFSEKLSRRLSWEARP